MQANSICICLLPLMKFSFCGINHKVNHISRTYQVGTEKIFALRDISLEIFKNEYVALMGSSGSGKSTLMNVLGCLDTPSGGEYF